MSREIDEVSLVNDSVVFDDAANDGSRNVNYQLTVFRGCMNTFVHSLIAVSVFVTLCFAFQSIPLSAFQLHIGLSVTGYQLMMSQGILSLASYNSWSSALNYTHRRRSHWLLQLIGSVLAIAGSVIMMKHKSVNFNTVHGKFALAAFVLTCISLLNGAMTLYRVRIGGVPFQAFKISHLLIGSSAFVVSSICLSFGIIKESFKKWSSNEFAYVMTGIIMTYTIIIVANPLSTIKNNLCKYVKSKIC